MASVIPGFDGIPVMAIGEDPKPAPNTDIDPLRLFSTANEEWVLDDLGNVHALTFRTKSWMDGTDRRVHLEPAGPMESRRRPLFGQYRSSRDGIALEQMRLTLHPNDVVFPVQPPLVLTRRDDMDHVAVLLPSGQDWSGTVAGFPTCSGTAQKLARSVKLPGVPGRLMVWAVKVVAKNPIGTVVLRATLQLLEGVGLVTHVGDAYGSYFALRRHGDLFPNTPQPIQPAFGILPQELLGLQTTKRNTYRDRADEKESTLSITGGPTEFRFQGEAPVSLSSVRIGGQGLEMVEMRLWGQPWKPPSPLVFSTRRLHVSERPSWCLWSFAKPSLPFGHLSRLHVRIAWSDDAADVPWASTAGGPYANIRSRFLRMDYQAVDTAGRVIPLEQEVLALTDQGLGILRIAHRTGEGKEQLWDLHAHA